MNYYYGLVDREKNGYGFIEETDERVTPDMIYITEEKWHQLLEEQSSGKEIVSFNGEVFATDEIGKYYIDEAGIWQMKSDGELISEQTEARKKQFWSNFISTSLGNYRKIPQGYANAPQSIDIILNIVTAQQGLNEEIAKMMIFYPTPDFTKAEECTEEWLVSNQYNPEPMTYQEFMNFYIDFQTRWAMQEYK